MTKEEIDLLTYLPQNRDNMSCSVESWNRLGGIEKDIGIHAGK
jgi:hypothetical protein